MFLTNKKFWLDTLERAIKTFAQGLVALFTADKIVGILNINWSESLSVAGMMAFISVLTSIGSGPVGPGNDASLIK